jgi:hypothetical protein
LTLEALGGAERVLVELLSLRALRMQPLCLAPDADRGPVRQATIVFMPALLDGERRVHGEVAILKLTDVLRPISVVGRPETRRPVGEKIVPVLIVNGSSPAAGEWASLGESGRRLHPDHGPLG